MQTTADEYYRWMRYEALGSIRIIHIDCAGHTLEQSRFRPVKSAQAHERLIHLRSRTNTSSRAELAVRRELDVAQDDRAALDLVHVRAVALSPAPETAGGADRGDVVIGCLQCVSTHRRGKSPPRRVAESRRENMRSHVLLLKGWSELPPSILHAGCHLPARLFCALPAKNDPYHSTCAREAERRVEWISARRWRQKRHLDFGTELLRLSVRWVAGGDLRHPYRGVEARDRLALLVSGVDHDETSSLQWLLCAVHLAADLTATVRIRAAAGERRGPSRLVEL